MSRDAIIWYAIFRDAYAQEVTLQYTAVRPLTSPAILVATDRGHYSVYWREPREATLFRQCETFHAVHDGF